MEKRSAKHRAVQKQGRKRDGNCCQICGSSTNVQGHHIFDYSLGGSPTCDNIVSLCSRCHSKVHGGFIDISVG